MWTAAIVLVTAVALVGGLVPIGLALRKLYKREGNSFAGWHKRQLLPALALGLSIPMIGGFIVIAAGASIQTALLFLIGAGLIWEVYVVLKRLQRRARRGAPLAMGSIPERRSNRLVPILAFIATGLLVAAMVVDKSIDLPGIVAIAEMGFAAVFLRPIEHAFYEEGVMEYTGFVPWQRFESFRYVVFDKTALFSFQLGAPGWFNKEVTVGVPTAEAEQLSRWLAGKLPCIGVQHERSLSGAVAS